jgi:prepilin-type N-terminal cleavage/methylation domain-containing protein
MKLHTSSTRLRTYHHRIGSNRNGFTMIELLVVLSIISTMTLITVGGIRRGLDKGKRAVALQNMVVLRSAIVAATQNEQKPLREITGRDCTDCACRLPNTVLSSLAKTHTCWTQWLDTKQKIETASGVKLSFDADPWGSPYIVDENEAEAHWGGPTGSNVTCDLIMSVGSRGMRQMTTGSYEFLAYILPNAFEQDVCQLQADVYLNGTVNPTP